MSSDFPLPIEIIGGGLAGLSLGVALQREGINTTIREAGDYPRHKVCGEFITGLDQITKAKLGIDGCFDQSLSLSHVQWFFGNRAARRQKLPRPAIGLSRYRLDERIAKTFKASGGNLLVKTSGDTAPAVGRVVATGRPIVKSEWIGLKIHLRELQTLEDLEVHLGNFAYVGLSKIEDGAVNVCGLFRQSSSIAPPGRPGSRGEYFARYLDGSGLTHLAGRIRAAVMDEESFRAVSALAYRPNISRLMTRSISIGDANAVIPPFTGNGMAMAFQSASLALDPLISYSLGETSWDETSNQISTDLRRHLKKRVFFAAMLHAFLYNPKFRRWLEVADRLRVLPLNGLYGLTH